MEGVHLFFLSRDLSYFAGTPFGWFLREDAVLLAFSPRGGGDPLFWWVWWLHLLKQLAAHVAFFFRGIIACPKIGSTPSAEQQTG